MYFSALFPCLLENTHGFLTLLLIDCLPLQIKPQAPIPVKQLVQRLTTLDGIQVCFYMKGYLTSIPAVSPLVCPVGHESLCLWSCGISVALTESLRLLRAPAIRQLNYLQSLL